MAINKVFIVGSGLMGSGIAQVCAQAGLQATLSDVSQEQLDKAVKNIAWSAGKLIEKGKVPGTIDEVMGRIATSVDLAPAAEADLVMEVVFENLEVKKEVFAKLNQVLTPNSLVASNTSAIPTSELATHVANPERFLGIHFFSPVPMMQAVEVIRGTMTSDEAFAAAASSCWPSTKSPSWSTATWPAS